MTRFQMQKWEPDVCRWSPMEDGPGRQTWHPRSTAWDAIYKCISWASNGLPAMQVVDLEPLDPDDDVVWRDARHYHGAGPSIGFPREPEIRAAVAQRQANDPPPKEGTSTMSDDQKPDTGSESPPPRKRAAKKTAAAPPAEKPTAEKPAATTSPVFDDEQHTRVAALEKAADLVELIGISVDADLSSQLLDLAEWIVSGLHPADLVRFSLTDRGAEVLDDVDDEPGLTFTGPPR